MSLPSSGLLPVPALQSLLTPRSSRSPSPSELAFGPLHGADESLVAPGRQGRAEPHQLVPREVAVRHGADEVREEISKDGKSSELGRPQDVDGERRNAHHEEEATAHVETPRPGQVCPCQSCVNQRAVAQRAQSTAHIEQLAPGQSCPCQLCVGQPVAQAAAQQINQSTGQTAQNPPEHTTAPDQPGVYRTQPTLAQILADATVNTELQRAWTESLPNAPSVPRGSPGSQKREQGGWIVWNKVSGALEVVRVPAGTRDGLATIMGTRPADNAQQAVVAWFHTHPNTAAENYSPEPSPPDLGFTTATARVPGIVETHSGRRTIPYP